MVMKPRVMSREECRELLSAARFGRLGLSADDVPYVVPISYVYAEEKIYLHSGRHGKKVKMAKVNPRVCFEVDVLEGRSWKSVLALGRASISEELEDKEKVFDAFMRSKMGGHGGQAFSRKDLENMPMCVWEIEIEEISGREGMW